MIKILSFSFFLISPRRMSASPTQFLAHWPAYAPPPLAFYLCYGSPLYYRASPAFQVFVRPSLITGRPPHTQTVCNLFSAPFDLSLFFVWVSSSAILLFLFRVWVVRASGGSPFPVRAHPGCDPFFFFRSVSFSLSPCPKPVYFPV